MNKTGWIVAAVSAVLALLLGFTAGWFSGHAYLRASLESAFEDVGAGVPEGMEGMEEYEEEMGGESGPLVVALGDTHDFGDGVTVTVADPTRFTEGDLCEEDGYDRDCYGEPDLEFVRTTVTVDNSSGQALDMSYVTVTCAVENAASDGGYYEELASPPDVLPDGQTAQWDQACEMDADESLLQVTVVVDTRQPVTFDGTV